MPPPPPSPRRVQFEAFELDLRTGELIRGGLPLDLPPQPTKVLRLLVERAGRLVTREELRDHLWPDTVVEFDHGLNTCIRQVREALGETAEAPTFIQTVPRRGYRFIAPVRPAESGAAAEGDGEPQPRGRGWSSVGALGVAVAVALIIVALMVPHTGSQDEHRRVAVLAPDSLSPVDPEARSEFLRGRYHLTNHRPAEAVKHLERATQRDPGYALAHAVLARARLWEGDTAGAAASAARALELGPGLPETRQALGDLAARARWDWSTALREYRAAIELAPGSAELRQGHAYVLSLLGRHAEAVAEMELALSLDPVSPLVSGDAAWLYFYARRHAEAIEQARATVALATDHASAWYCLVVALEADGRLAEAQAVARDVAERYGAPSQVVAEIESASPPEAVDRFWRWDLEQMWDHELGSRYPLDFAAAYARFRQPDRALAFIERSIESGSLTAPIIAVDPRFDQIRSDPRFTRALARLNLPVSSHGS